MRSDRVQVGASRNTLRFVEYVLAQVLRRVPKHIPMHVHRRHVFVRLMLKPGFLRHVLWYVLSILSNHSLVHLKCHIRSK